MGKFSLSLSKLKNSIDFKLIITIILWILLSRIFIHLIAYSGYFLWINKSLHFLESFSSLWHKWDSIHYIHIAENWYTGSGEDRFLIVYFPFYPLLIKVLTFLTGNYFLSGFLISQFSLFFSAYFLFNLTNMDFGEKTAWRSLRFLLIFPFSFFLSIIYSDSLFLALSLASIYYLRKQKWLLAGLFGLMTSLTRNFGVLLVIPAIIEYCQTRNIFNLATSGKLASFFKNLGKQWIFLILIPLGSGIYLFMNRMITGDFFTFLIYQKEHWHQNFGFLWHNLQNMVINILTWPPKDKVSLWIPQFLLFWFSIFIFFYLIKKIRISYLIYFAIYLFIAYSPTWLLSGPRYLLGAFPLYIGLGLISENQTIDFICSFLMILFLAFYILAFTRGFYVM